MYVCILLCSMHVICIHIYVYVCSMYVSLRCRSPAQTVGERGGSAGVTLPVERRAVSPGAQRPEGRGGARQVQADVPERVYGGGDATGWVGTEDLVLAFPLASVNMQNTDTRWQHCGDFGTPPTDVSDGGSVLVTAKHLDPFLLPHSKALKE